MKWNINSILEVHFDNCEIEADTEDEAIQIFKERVEENHNLRVIGYGEFQPTQVDFEINIDEDEN